MIRFLQQSKTALAARQSTAARVHAVIGNEACDLDSAASALAYAYLLSSMDTETLFLPVLNIAEDEYPLKTEVAFFLHKLGITKDSLIFRPSVDLAGLHRAGRLLITLVDRHRLDGPDSSLQPCVVQVLDHHEPDRPLSDDVTIEPVGSCCTLVAERLFQLNRNLIDRTVADLLLGTIVLDTVNMSTVAQRVTPKDRLMVSFLEPLSSGESPDQLFDMLQRAKGDVGQLSSFQLLRKDQKTVDGASLRLTVSSLPMLVQDFVRSPDAVSACNQLCQSAGRDALVLMGSRAAGGGAEFARDLAVFSARDDVRHQVCAALEEAVSPCLGLARISSPHPRLTLFTQANVAASRKAVLPLLRAHLATVPAAAGPGGSGELSPVGRSATRPSPPPLSHHALSVGLRTDLPVDVRPPNGVDLALSAQVATLLEPASTGGSSQSSAYNSVPYTPQNSVADSDSVGDVSLPSFNSRELLQRIELRRGPLGGFEGADDIGAYPFTPKNSFVESSLETAYRQMNIAELDSDTILQKVHEKKRKNDLFDDIEEEEGGGAAGGLPGGPLGDRRGQNGAAVTPPRSSRAGTSYNHQTDSVRMRSDRGPGFGGADLTPADGKSAGSTGSLREPLPLASSADVAHRTAVLSPGADGGLTSDVDDDTATFKSALSSSEAIRRRDEAAAMATASDVASPVASVGSTNGSPPGAVDPAKLWRVADGRTVRDIVEHGLGGGGGGGGDSGPRSVSFGPLPAGGHDSLGFESSGGPESLNQLSLTPLDDDYYEDFTLPGTHEGVMSRQKSFRRRVRAAPVTEPDADRIERLVRAGELERHGSIRRKLVASAAPAAGPTAAAGSPGQFGRDLREIEELMAEEGDQVAIDDLPSLGPVLGSSTPRAACEPAEQPLSLPPLSDEPLSIEMSNTMLKIRECLDREKLKDIYTISGRLQDILTQEDIQEILTHSEMFAELLGEAILAELRSSISGSQQSTPPKPSPATEANRAMSRSPPTPAPRNAITVQAEVNAVTDRDESSSLSPSPSPTPSLREIAAAESDATLDTVAERDHPTPTPAPRQSTVSPGAVSPQPGLPAAPEDGPSSLPAESASRAEEAPSPGALWRSGSLRRLGGGPPVEALFAESGSGPAAGQRRLRAPVISLDEPETAGDGRVGLSADPSDAKPGDADSGVSETGTGDWQASGENLPQALTEEEEAPGRRSDYAEDADRPASLSGPLRRKKISVSADVLADQDDSMSACSAASRLDSEEEEPVTPTEALATSDLLDTLTPDDIETPDELEESILERLPPAEPIPEYTAREELNDERSWRTCVVAGLERRIDMKVIEPYKKVLSHGGYLGLEGDQAIVVFSACYLPDRSRKDYSYVMDNLFLYVLTTLDALIAEDYVLIYLHGATQRSCMPSFGWLKRCYQMVDRRLRKNLKGLYLVHPTFWVKTIVALTRPFISSKFSRKLRFVASLRELSQLVPMDQVCIPDRVKQLDFQLMIAERKKQLGIR